MNTKFSLIRFIQTFWISILVCIAILTLCCMKTDGMVEVSVPDFDKLVHSLMFLGLSGVVFFDNTHYFRRAVNGQRIFFGSFLLSASFGGLIEIIQTRIYYRSGDWMDFLFDVIGALTGVLICLLINRRLKTQTNG